MKINFLVIVFVVFNTVSVYCGGLTENNLVNTREIELENINEIDIVYS
jgi:hypothetical protein